MTVTSGHFTLTAEQRQFKQMLDAYPHLAPYWDFDKRECDIDGLRKAFGTLSHGEAIMARFFSAVWLGENTLDFDLIEAAKTLDQTQLQVIIDWLSNPAFP